MAPRRDTIERLVRQVYGMNAVRRDLHRRALAQPAGAGLLALSALQEAGPARVSHVADALQVDLSVASRQIAALEAAGHVAREPDPFDGRSHVLRVTDAGHAAIQDAHEQMVEAFAAALDGWPEDEVRRLAAGLGRLRADYACAVLREGALVAPGEPRA